MSWKDRATKIESSSPSSKTGSWRDRAVAVPVSAPAGESYDEFDSAARGTVQGLTMGFADEITGGVEALGDTLFGDKSISDIGDTYAQRRDESRANYDAARDANPKSYMAGEVGGTVASAFVPGLGALNAAKGAGLAAVAGRAAIQGGIQGLGTSDAQSVGDMARDTAMGAGMGAVGGALGHGAGKLIGKGADAIADSSLGKYISGKVQVGADAVGDRLDSFAERQGAKALGLERATQKKLGEDGTRAVGRQALDEGILSIGANTDDLIARNNALKSLSMSERQAAYETIDAAGKSQFNPLDVAAKVEDKVVGGMNRSHLDTQELIGKLEPELQNILSRGEGTISMAEAQQLVQNLGQKAKWDASRSTQNNQLAKDVYGVVRQAINDAAGSDQVGIEGLKETIEQANKKFSIAKDTEKLLGNKQAREQGNKLFGLTDTIAGAGALTTGNPAVALPIMAAKKIGEKYGNQTAAITADRLADIVRQAPQSLGKYAPALQKAAQRGGQALAVSNYVLMQNNPEYRDMIMKMGKGDDE